MYQQKMYQLNVYLPKSTSNVKEILELYPENAL